MNILISAYACEPNKGSEPGVGWSWAIELSKYHNVWVLTRDNNEPTISAYLIEHPKYINSNLHFIYVGLSKKLTFWKKGRRGMRLFYMLWQNKALKTAMVLHHEEHFDLIHHVTFVSYTQPTYMYKLGIPMIWGPVAGGDVIPKCIKIKIKFKERLLENIRLCSQDLALYFPSIRKTMKLSNYILVATEETKDKIRDKYYAKTIVMPAIGIDELPDLSLIEKKDDKIRIIMAGRLVYLKAVDIGLNAFMKIADRYPNCELHILGEGECKESLIKMSGKMLNKQIFFDPPVIHDEILEFYQKFDIFLNTSLRDSGCMTMMEAMSVGLPCICVAVGGPNTISDEKSAIKIKVNNEIDNYEMIVERTSRQLEKLVAQHELRVDIGLNARNYIANNLTFEKKYNYIYSLIKL